MLSPSGWQKNSAAAKSYFKDHLTKGDYHSEKGKVQGIWLGKGAESLGLSGEVRQKDFENVLEGKDPKTGESLCPREKAERRTHKDFVLSPPKSVSILAALATPKERAKIEAAHDRSVIAAANEMEKHAARRDRSVGAQKSDLIKTDNLVIAVFRHDTSRPTSTRPPDPHLHSHLVTANLTQGADGMWFAVEDSQILKNQKVIEATYDSHMAGQLSKMGYRIESDGKKSWRIAEIDERADKIFSKRHQEIERKTQEKTAELVAEGKTIGNQKDVAEIVAHEGRKGKLKDLSSEDLRKAWREELTQHGIAQDGLRSMPPNERGISQRINSKQAAAHALSHLTEREAVISRQQLIAEATRHALGSGLTPNDIEKRLQSEIKSGKILLSGDSITTRQALATEQKLLRDAKSGRGQVSPILEKASAYTPSPKLSDEQQAAAKTILTSTDRTVIIRGAAGTGKSTLLKEIVAQTEAAGHKVLIAAPMGRQSEGLRADGFSAAQTLSKLMMKPIPKGATVILDEAGQTGVAELAKLQGAVAKAGGRLILTGDARQHGSVAQGDALRHLERDSGVTRAELCDIRRQDASRAATPEEAQKIAKYKQAAVAASRGETATSYEIMNKMGAIQQVAEPIQAAAEIAIEKSREGSVLVVSQTRASVENLNKMIRGRKLAAGEISPVSKKFETLKALDLTQAEKGNLSSYKAGNYLAFNQKHGDFAKGAAAEILSTDTKKNQVVVKAENGKIQRVGLGNSAKWQLAEKHEIDLAPGDQVLLRQNGRAGKKAISNGEVARVKTVGENGQISLEDGRILPINYKMIDYGYACTSFSAQGRTVEHVVISDSGNRAATSSRQWYVDLTRGRKSATILTQNKESFKQGILHKGESKLASDVAWQRPPSARQRFVEIARKMTHKARDGLGHTGNLVLSALRRQGLPERQAQAQTQAGSTTKHKNPQKEREAPDLGRQPSQSRPPILQKPQPQLQMERTL